MDLQRKRAAQMPCQDVVVYCVSCTQSMATGGKTPHHLTDLVLCKATMPLPQGLEEYHAALGRYIEEH